MIPAFIALVKSKAAITAVLGSSPVRLYPNVLKQGATLPAATYRTVSNMGNPSFDGASLLDFNHIDVHAFGTTRKQAEELCDLLRRQLEDSKGTFAGVEIRNVRYVDSGTDDYLDDLKMYTKSVEFRISTIR